ncbi:MAG: adenosylcobinamide-GDP ribazoletransferase [Streptosporangiaceae bacterium]
MLTVFPVRVDRVDRETARSAMLWAPAVGALVGACQALVHLLFAGTGGLLAAALAVGSGAVLTRALHLDGLADVADGLGSGRPGPQALEIMKRSDIGPFGVVALLFTLLIQVAALTAAPHPAAALVVSAAAGRLAITWACTPGVPAARPDGLGATVAGTVPLASAVALTVALLLASTAALPWLAAPAVLGGLTAAHLFRRHLTRRLGGVTGDVLGSLTELTATTTLVILTLG